MGRPKIVLSDEQCAYLQELAQEHNGAFGIDVWRAFNVRFPNSTMSKSTLEARFKEIWAQTGHRDEANSSNKQVVCLNIEIY